MYAPRTSNLEEIIFIFFVLRPVLWVWGCGMPLIVFGGGAARRVLSTTLLLLVPAGAWDKISCPQRISTAGVDGYLVPARDPSAMFVCPAGAHDALKYTAPAQWHTLAASSGSGSAIKAYAGAWLRGQAPCCRHCVWELGYPAIDPIVLASDRTSTNATLHLDCAAFATEFRALDRNADAKLDEEELSSMHNYVLDNNDVDFLSKYKNNQ